MAEIKVLDLTTIKKVHITLVEFIKHNKTKQEQAGII
jgi:hypothetical protein